MTLLAFCPFLLLFVGLGLTKIKSHFVTSITFLFVIASSLILFNTSASDVIFAALEGAITALVPIIWVIFSAVLSYEVSIKSGAITIISEFLTSLTSDKALQAVLIAFCFGGFLEAVAGFGSAVAIPTAMMISLGIEPISAAVVALVANSVPVAFGALGIPIIALSDVSGLDLHTLTRNVAIQLAVFSVLIPLAIVFIAKGREKVSRVIIIEALGIGVTFTVFQTLTAFFIGPELVAITGSLGSLACYILLKILFTHSRLQFNRKDLFIATINYSILLALVLITRLVQLPSLKRVPFIIPVSIGGHVVKIDYLTTPGTLLIVSTLIGALFQGVELMTFLVLAKEAARKIKNAAVSIVFLLMIAKVMAKAGMIALVAGAMAAFSKSYFPLLSPIIGGLGTFLTGSDTSSNILFGQLQKQTAVSLNTDPSWLAAANTSGATAGKMISPQSLNVVASILGDETSRQEIFRRNLIYCSTYLAVLAIVVWMASGS